MIKSITNINKTKTFLSGYVTYFKFKIEYNRY
jgi:hypothetical protein